MPHPVYSPADLALFRHYRRPLMPSGIRYALAPAPASPEKPLAFDSLNGLCRSIHRARRGAAIQLEDGEMLFQGETTKRDVVSIYALDEHGARCGFLGVAWLDGRRLRTLRDALYQAEANPQAHMVAA
jgi:hypothetical protein